MKIVGRMQIILAFADVSRRQRFTMTPLTRAYLNLDASLQALPRVNSETQNRGVATLLAPASWSFWAMRPENHSFWSLPSASTSASPFNRPHPLLFIGGHPTRVDKMYSSPRAGKQMNQGPDRSAISLDSNCAAERRGTSRDSHPDPLLAMCQWFEGNHE